MHRFNRLLHVIRTTLADVVAAMRGEALLSPALESMVEDLQLGVVPHVWTRIFYPTTKTLSSYLVDLGRRVSFFADWASHGPPPVMWFPAFFFTQGFLTGGYKERAPK
jgi:dynein heavy chain